MKINEREGHDFEDAPGTDGAGEEVEGWTKQELIDAGEISAKTFDTIRKAARVKGPGHGGLGWVFGAEEVIALIQRAESGRFTERGGGPAIAWRRLLAERGVMAPEAKRMRGRGNQNRGERGRERKAR